MVLGTSNDLELMDRLARDLSQGDVRATASPVAADRDPGTPERPAGARSYRPGRRSERCPHTNITPGGWGGGEDRERLPRAGRPRGRGPPVRSPGRRTGPDQDGPTAPQV